MQKKKLGLFIATIICTLTNTACNQSADPQKQQVVKDMQLSAHQDKQDIILELKTMLSMGNTQTAALDLTIADPYHPDEMYGRLGLRQVLAPGSAMTSELDLEINFTKLTGLNVLAGPLPNGTPIPVYTGQNPVLGIPVGGDGIRIYGSYGPGTAMIGIAVPIREFNAAGSYVGGLNVFPMFEFGGGVRGVAGFFAGNQPNQSGLALFVDASAALAALNPPSSWVAPGPRAKALADAAPANELKFVSPKVSKKKLKKFYRELHRLDQQKAILHPAY